MNKTKFLDEEGLKVLWAQIKNYQGKSLVEELANYVTVEELAEKLKDLPSGSSDSIRFRGVFDDLEDVTDPKNGDIVLVGSKEYIYSVTENPDSTISTGEWKLFGDEGIYFEPKSLSREEILAICSEQEAEGTI